MKYKLEIITHSGCWLIRGSVPLGVMAFGVAAFGVVAFGEMTLWVMGEDMVPFFKGYIGPADGEKRYLLPNQAFAQFNAREDMIPYFRGCQKLQ